MEQAEQTSKDLAESGNDSVSSLDGMLVKKQKALECLLDEIKKFEQLDALKEDEICGLNEEISTLEQYKRRDHEHFLMRAQEATEKIEHNHAVIKRNDKLIVDLQQKNELIQIGIAVTDEQIQGREKETSRLDI